ncbi:S-adenosyl-L-methionine-dependent methyltransferase [Blakeslea trispora]|nr:S-adenosyl-L-methionine-dependent methyltransferase [Blakeslea trispora]
MNCSTPDDRGILRKILSRNSSHCIVDEPVHDYFSRQPDNSSKYCIQMDNNELDRLTDAHFILKHIYDGNASAPVDQILSKPTLFTHDNSQVTISVPSSPTSFDYPNHQHSPRVLDVACGHGVWVMEMASSYPHAQFYGIDICHQFPTSIKPANAHFLQRDLLNTDGLPYPDGYFDYIHMRSTYNCFSFDDVKFVMRELSRVLKPGGYMEVREVDPILQNRGPTTDFFFSNFAQRMLEHHQVDITWPQHLQQLLTHEAGLMNLHKKEVSMNFGVSSPFGNLLDASVVDACKSYRQFFMDSCQLSSEECDEKLAIIAQECVSYQSYVGCHMAWGQKPLHGTMTPLSSYEADHTMVDIVHFADGYME